ncbi:hypothetical protein B0H19DRAFT_1381083 [Mycena capillaripes]|nr:hypothetical protein B0H19DRAFT_1381083 [Mycena capillaripes]
MSLRSGKTVKEGGNGLQRRISAPTMGVSAELTPDSAASIPRRVVALNTVIARARQNSLSASAADGSWSERPDFAHGCVLEHARYQCKSRSPTIPDLSGSLNFSDFPSIIYIAEVDLLWGCRFHEGKDSISSSSSMADTTHVARLIEKAGTLFRNGRYEEAARLTIAVDTEKSAMYYINLAAEYLKLQRSDFPDLVSTIAHLLN